jgi:type II secretory pathway pseudopilin PulG
VKALIQRVRRSDAEAGLTLIELLVAATLSVIVVGAATSMLISAVRQQPEISQSSQDISTARYVLERMTREIRNGVTVVAKESSASTLAFTAYTRHATCGGTGSLAAAESARVCKITYSCSATGCTRAETDSTATGPGTAVPLIGGIDNAKVFSYSPDLEEATFVGATLRIPERDGDEHLTISDGATLRGGNPFE